MGFACIIVLCYTLCLYTIWDRRERRKVRHIHNRPNTTINIHVFIIICVHHECNENGFSLIHLNMVGHFCCVWANMCSNIRKYGRIAYAYIWMYTIQLIIIQAHHPRPRGTGKFLCCLWQLKRMYQAYYVNSTKCNIAEVATQKYTQTLTLTRTNISNTHIPESREIHLKQKKKRMQP